MNETLKKELRLIYNTEEQSHGRKRITCLDMTRGIMIILVVIGHSGLITASCNTWLSTFHLPSFFLLSGVLMQLKAEEKSPLPVIILQKARSIMIPYLWFSFGSVCLDLLQVLLGKFTWDIVLEHTLQTITLQGYSVLWFLPVLFFAEVMLLSVHKACRKFVQQDSCRITFITLFVTCFSVLCYYGYRKLLVLAIPQLALFSIRILVKAVIAASFMSYGYVFGSLSKNLLSSLSGKNPESLSSEKLGSDAPHFKDYVFRRNFLLAKLSTFLTGALLFAINIILLPKIQLMDFNQLNLQSPWIYLALGTTGSLGCLLMCIGLPNIPLITFFGQNSLIIMCTHMNFYVMYLSMLVNQFVVARIPGAGRITYAVLSLTGTMLLSIPVIVVIRMYFPFVLGKKFTYKA